jgi:hypothetical protein
MKNFQANTEAFSHIPNQPGGLYIFPGRMYPLIFLFRRSCLTQITLYLAADPDPNALPPTDPHGQIPNPYAFNLSQVKPTQLPGGTIKIADSTNFTVRFSCSARGLLTELLVQVSNTIAVAEITVQPGAMR